MNEDLTAPEEPNVLVEDLTDGGTPKQPPSEGAVKSRAVKFDIALGDASPGVPAIEEEIQRGAEDELRNLAAAKAEERQTKAGKELVVGAVTAGENIEPKVLKQVLTIDKKNPDSVVEEEYVNKSTDYILASSKNQNLRKTMEEGYFGPELSPYNINAVRNNIMETITEDYKARAAARGWLPWAGGELVSMLGVPTWLNLSRNPEGAPESSSWTMNAMKEKADKIWAAHPNQMATLAKAELEALWSFNPSDAMQFLDYLNNRSTSEIVFQNAMLATTLPVAKPFAVGKGLAKGAVNSATRRIRSPKVSEAAVEAQKAFDDINQALAIKGAEPHEVLSSAGNVEDAADILAREKIANAVETIAPDASPLTKEALRRTMRDTPSIFNPSLSLTGAEKFAAKNADKLTKLALKNLKHSTGILRKHGMINTLTKEAEAAAFTAARAELEASVPSFDDLVKGVAIDYLPDNNLGVGQVSIAIGTKTGLHASREEAIQMATQQLKLADNAYTIEQQGTGYFVRMYKTVKEFGDGTIDDAFLSGNNKSNFNDSMWQTAVKEITGGKIIASTAQKAERAASAHAPTSIESNLSALYKPVQELYINGSKREWDDFNKILEIGRTAERVPGDIGTRGKFYKSVYELSEAYMMHMKRLPSDLEINAYHTFVQISDIDYLSRSIRLWKDKAKRGVEVFEAKAYNALGEKVPLSIEGNKLTEFPTGSKTFLEIDENGANRTHNLSKLKDDYKKRLKEEFESGKLVFIKRESVENTDLDPFLGNRHTPVNYVAIRNPSKGELKIDTQLNYKPGGHIIYPHKHFVKQALVEDDEYRGDLTLLGADTPAEAAANAQKIATALEKYNAKAADFADYLRKNLPWTPEDFQKLIDDGILKKDMPVAAVRAGERTVAAGVRFSDGRYFKDIFKGIPEGDLSAYGDLYKGAEDFTQAKTGPLKQIRKGSEGEPAYVLEDARMVNPIQSQIQSMRKLVSDTVYEDYQLQAARSWIEEFGNSNSALAAGLSYDGKQLSMEQLRKNPIFYLGHATVSSRDPLRNRQAEQVRASIKRLMGTPSKLAMGVDYVKFRMADSAYKRGNEKLARYISDKEIPFLKDPFSYMRAMAFHTKLGMFNPVQLFVQGTTYLNSVAIAPKYAVKASVASAMMMKSSLTMDPKIQRAMAKVVSKTSQMSEEQYLDSLHWMNEFGIDHIGKEYAWLDDASDPTMFRGTVGHVFLDKGPAFFNTAERLVRLQGWNTAYLEAVAKNGGKKLTQREAKEVLVRSQTMFANMTRDANSFWQRGLLGNFTQFYSFNARMMELMIGKQLTKIERLRLASFYGIMYGVPIIPGMSLAIENKDLGMAVTSVNPFDEDIRQYALNKGYAIDEGVTARLYHGLAASLYHASSGEWLNVGERYGINPINLGETIEKNFDNYDAWTALGVTLAGAGGSIGMDIATSISPILSDMIQMAKGTGTTTVLANDAFTFGRNISSVNVADQVLSSLLGWTYRSKNGTNLEYDRGDTMHEVMKSFTGLKNIEESDVFRKIKSMKDRSAEMKEIQKRVREMMGYYRDAAVEDRTAIRKQIEAWLSETIATPDEAAKMIFGFQDERLIDLINEEHKKNILGKAK